MSEKRPFTLMRLQKTAGFSAGFRIGYKLRSWT